MSYHELSKSKTTPRRLRANLTAARRSSFYSGAAGARSRNWERARTQLLADHIRGHADRRPSDTASQHTPTNASFLFSNIVSTNQVVSPSVQLSARVLQFSKLAVTPDKSVLNSGLDTSDDIDVEVKDSQSITRKLTVSSPAATVCTGMEVKGEEGVAASMDHGHTPVKRVKRALLLSTPSKVCLATIKSSGGEIDTPDSHTTDFSGFSTPIKNSSYREQVPVGFMDTEPDDLGSKEILSTAQSKKVQFTLKLTPNTPQTPKRSGTPKSILKTPNKTPLKSSYHSPITNSKQLGSWRKEATAVTPCKHASQDDAVYPSNPVVKVGDLVSHSEHEFELLSPTKIVNQSLDSLQQSPSIFKYPKMSLRFGSPQKFSRSPKKSRKSPSKLDTSPAISFSSDRKLAKRLENAISDHMVECDDDVSSTEIDVSLLPDMSEEDVNLVNSLLFGSVGVPDSEIPVLELSENSYLLEHHANLDDSVVCNSDSDDSDGDGSLSPPQLPDLEATVALHTTEKTSDYELLSPILLSNPREWYNHRADSGGGMDWLNTEKEIAIDTKSAFCGITQKGIVLYNDVQCVADDTNSAPHVTEESWYSESVAEGCVSSQDVTEDSEPLYSVTEYSGSSLAAVGETGSSSDVDVTGNTDSSLDVSEDTNYSLDVAENTNFSQSVAQDTDSFHCEAEDTSSQDVAEDTSQGVAEDTSSQGVAEDTSSQGVAEDSSSQGVVEDTIASQGVAEDSSSSQCVAENSNSLQDVTEDISSSQDVAEDTNSSQDVTQNSNAPWDVAENSNSSQGVADNINVSLDVAETGSSQEVTENYCVSQNVAEDNNAFHDMAEDTGPSQDIGEDSECYQNGGSHDNSTHRGSSYDGTNDTNTSSAVNKADDSVLIMTEDGCSVLNAAVDDCALTDSEDANSMSVVEQKDESDLAFDETYGRSSPAEEEKYLTFSKVDVVAASHKVGDSLLEASVQVKVSKTPRVILTKERLCKSAKMAVPTHKRAVKNHQKEKRSLSTNSEEEPNQTVNQENVRDRKILRGTIRGRDVKKRKAAVQACRKFADSMKESNRDIKKRKTAVRECRRFVGSMEESSSDDSEEQSYQTNMKKRIFDCIITPEKFVDETTLPLKNVENLPYTQDKPEYIDAAPEDAQSTAATSVQNTGGVNHTIESCDQQQDSFALVNDLTEKLHEDRSVSPSFPQSTSLHGDTIAKPNRGQQRELKKKSKGVKLTLTRSGDHYQVTDTQISRCSSDPNSSGDLDLHLSCSDLHDNLDSSKSSLPGTSRKTSKQKGPLTILTPHRFTRHMSKDISVSPEVYQQLITLSPQRFSKKSRVDAEISKEKHCNNTMGHPIHTSTPRDTGKSEEWRVSNRADSPTMKTFVRKQKRKHQITDTPRVRLPRMAQEGINYDLEQQEDESTEDWSPLFLKKKRASYSSPSIQSLLHLSSDKILLDQSSDHIEKDSPRCSAVKRHQNSILGGTSTTLSPNNSKLRSSRRLLYSTAAE